MALQARLPRWGMTRFTGVRVLQVRIHLPPAVSRQPNRVSLPRFHVRIGLHIVLFEACSAFTRVAACTLARSPYVVTAIRRLQTLRLLHVCSGRFRLERSPGGAYTHWKSAALSRRTQKADVRKGPAARRCRVASEYSSVAADL